MCWQHGSKHSPAYIILRLPANGGVVHTPSMAQVAPAGPAQTLTVAVPAGVSPGQSFGVQAPDGRVLQLVCPAGGKEGMLLTVPVPQQY